MDEGVVAASGYGKELAHNCYRILCLMTIYDVVFYPHPHFLPVQCRKSRNSLFSICNR